ncbi:protein-glutamate O-methyltransferase CheR [Aneurinibacillus sp. Ricciae_BoGa-3]|uniref:CheR family methyltransferase n=1 Tax=Aneurinibacillus sp. Ricciae_BoGa-3 TaxID=3022697 RepID=UPI0023424CF8|nr:protein-glutamate O-methyltransferase CheR [Aneurinibacillus sp. Ricciae_BoGa-3]WCK56080.1 protein-glutamate O-methyltransferase CheR [Aneurinibacillus sp. Ricciae_BoGa-3]
MEDKDFLQFIELVKQKTGIDLSLYKEAQMKRRLTSLYTKRGFKDFASFFEGMTKQPELFNEFLDRMTINVSEFFRNPSRWQVLQEKIIPRLLKEKGKIKCWSAACSTGEEPYSLAMLFSRFMPLSQIDITATDLDEGAIAKAKKGLYAERSLQDAPKDLVSKYFRKEPPMYAITEDIKRVIKFKKQNLLADRFDANHDLIVCRNVMIYFTDEAKDELYLKFSAALRPGGVLFVGSTEQIFQPAQYNFEPEDTFFYRKV